MVTNTSNHGNITITGDVITTLVGASATTCFGVKGMAKRSMTDGLVHLLKREFMGKGVHVTYGPNNEINIELHIAVDYGVNLSALTESIMSEVRYKVENTTGAKVMRVDVFIDSMLID